LLSFVESAPRAYWLKASNAAPSFSTFPGTIPRRAAPLLGVAGVSLALAGGASARTSGSGEGISSRDTAARHEITLNEEEISDISLATFYVFDKENAYRDIVSSSLTTSVSCLMASTSLI
jgi:hypothetical protein